MATAAFKGGWTFKRETTTPDTFETLPEVLSVSGLGKSSDTIEVTNADSSGVREYIPGLADGSEITVECNYLPGNAIQGRMIDDADAAVNHDYQLTITDGSTSKTYDFVGSPLGWELGPAIDAANKISFRIKISGDITVS